MGARDYNGRDVYTVCKDAPRTHINFHTTDGKGTLLYGAFGFIFVELFVILVPRDAVEIVRSHVISVTRD